MGYLSRIKLERVCLSVCSMISHAVGFFLACEDFGRICDDSFPASAFVVVVVVLSGI